MKFLKLLSLLPVSSCTAERLFSGMKLVKTHLRTTVTKKAKPLCYYSHLQYVDLVEQLDEVEIMREFVNNDRRV